MARKRNAADAAVEYFETAPLEAAAALLAVCRGIVDRRQPGKPARTPRTAARGSTASSSTPAPGASHAPAGRVEPGT
jgi:hypothetical protein